MFGLGDNYLSQAELIEWVDRRAAALGGARSSADDRPGCPHPYRSLSDQAAIRVVLASGDEKGAGGQGLGSPVIGIALVEDIGGPELDRYGTARYHVVNLGRVSSNQTGRLCRGSWSRCNFRPRAHSPRRRGIEQQDQRLALPARRLFGLKGISRVG